MKTVSTDIMVDASPERLWAILTDFPSFPSWNPFISKIEGQPVPGTKLVARLTPPGGRAVTFKPKVLKVEANRELRWKGRLAVPGLFSGEHIFTLEAQPGGGVRFVQAEIFKGLLVGMLSKVLDGETKSGFTAMNEALKAKAEAPA